MNSLAVDPREIVALCAVDHQLYCKTFFPRTFRQDFPEFDQLVTDALENPAARYVGLKMFRGSAKTTRLRAYVSKRIAYALSNTILFVGNAQRHAGYSLKWLKRQVEFNTQWAQLFQLRPGPTWNEEHLMILHGAEGFPINVMALGITGQVRGINLDDFRPDLIVIDDPDNEETTNTPEQREKTSDLVFGALQNSLTPPTENPNAKMVILQTPFNEFDLITTCEKSPKWNVQTVSCFDDRTGESTWSTRFPTEYLRGEKQEYIRLNKISLWMREMECKIVARENASFDVEWLKYWDDTGIPPGCTKIIAIDPASSEAKDADDQVIGVVAFRGKDVYLCEYTAEKGELPEMAAVTFLNYLSRHVVHRAVVESVGYQRTLATYLENAMRQARRWVLVDQIQDRRHKADRIIQALREKAAHGHLHVSVKHTKFIQQFAQFRPGMRMHDDVLDMVAMAISANKGYGQTVEGEFDVLDESSIPELEFMGRAP